MRASTCSKPELLSQTLNAAGLHCLGLGARQIGSQMLTESAYLAETSHPTCNQHQHHKPPRKGKGRVVRPQNAFRPACNETLPEARLRELSPPRPPEPMTSRNTCSILSSQICLFTCSSIQLRLNTWSSPGYRKGPEWSYVKPSTNR